MDISISHKYVSRFICALLVLACSISTTFASTISDECRAYLTDDTLVIRNSVIEQQWVWNGGDISLYSMKRLDNKAEMIWETAQPDFALDGAGFIRNINFKVDEKADGLLLPAHLEISFENQYRTFLLKRVLRIFPGVAAVTSDFYLKYSTLDATENAATKKADGTESALNRVQNRRSHLAHLGLNSKHIRVDVVDFKDATDVNNNLVDETALVPFTWGKRLKGNLLMGENLETLQSFFVLKEAPNGTSQVSYPSYDYEVSNREISVPFSGFALSSDSAQWIKGYSLVLGLAANKKQSLIDLRTYLKSSIPYKSEKYEMLMMNTWGDRGQDGRISESFILAELEKAHRLGITHFQIDDGWQQGLSSNSVHKTGNLWAKWSPENWKPNAERFPNGFKPVLDQAKEYGIKLGLWFHPSNANSYASWQTDADILVNLYKETGITYFKIDGVELDDKLAETNLEKLFTKVKEETNGEVFFNLDLTAGVRGGYFSYRPFGNLFLENRYTDWGNYYPYQTLRNVWMLSRYFPPELLQVEFLNKWRNADKYPTGDPFAPSNYDFDYLFAIAMVGQPLAWFEGTRLPLEAEGLSSVIGIYRSIQADFHAGTILPIGDEPLGRSWTGFQSINGNEGYFLIFRENTPEKCTSVKTWLDENTQVKCTPVFGGGESFIQTIGKDGTFDIELSHVNSYALYKYQIITNK